MIEGASKAAFDWDSVDLVVFDVDGTLYAQRPLRVKMAFALLLYSLRTMDTTVLSVIGAYRRCRERMGDQEQSDFEPLLLAEVAREAKCSTEQVAEIVGEWIERRPLAYLKQARYPDVVGVFAALRRRGKKIGVFSDYPAAEKLDALELAADYIVSATDPNIRALKPNPRGLEYLLQAADVPPERTMMIGDREERDGLAAQRAGVRCLIRSSRPVPGWLTFRTYSDQIFAPLLAA